MSPVIPRFVPTLTDVLGSFRQPSESSGTPDKGAIQPGPGARKESSPSLLRDSLGNGGAFEYSEDSESLSSPEFLEPVERYAGTEISQAELMHRVLQRVDMMLADRLAAAITTVIAQHTREMVPALREEIAEAVRVSVADAMSQELSDKPVGSETRAQAAPS